MDDEDQPTDLGCQPDSEDMSEDANPDDKDNHDEFMQRADDEEANEDSGSMVVHPTGPSVSMGSHKPIATSNPLRCGGPGKSRSSVPTWLHANYTDMCERLKKEMSKNQSR